ncbi:MAG: hypothetical protein WC378_00030 [Opitutaceae bacterium]|jgi:hypothetical protein
MIQQINCDGHWRSIAGDQAAKFGEPGVLKRQSKYGCQYPLVPCGEALADKLVLPADYKEVIAHCHERQIFPMYHQHRTWAPPGFQWTQNGLNYCWSWSVVAALMDAMAREAKAFPLLSPVSLGWSVNWANAGNYLSSAVSAAMERGVCSMAFTPDPHSRSYRSYVDGWEEDALKNRIAEAWDTDNSSAASMIQHCVTILKTGNPLQIAYDWEGHALELAGLVWDESKPNNLRWVIRNSHNENDLIERSGTKAVPDEAIGIRATKD